MSSIKEFKLLNHGKNPQQNKRLMERAIMSAADNCKLAYLLPGYVPELGEKKRSAPTDPGNIMEYLQANNHSSPDDTDSVKVHLSIYQILSKEYEDYTNRVKELRQFLLNMDNSNGDIFQRLIASHNGQLQHVPILDMYHILMTYHSALTESELAAVKVSMTAPWDPATETFDNVVHRFTEGQDLLAYANDPQPMFRVVLQFGTVLTNANGKFGFYVDLFHAQQILGKGTFTDMEKAMRSAWLTIQNMEGTARLQPSANAAVTNSENRQRATTAPVVSELPERIPATSALPANTTQKKATKNKALQYCWNHGRCYHSGETCNWEPKLTKEQYGPSITWENRDSHGGSQKDSKSRYK